MLDFSLERISRNISGNFRRRDETVLNGNSRRKWESFGEKLARMANFSRIEAKGFLRFLSRKDRNESNRMDFFKVRQRKNCFLQRALMIYAILARKNLIFYFQLKNHNSTRTAACQSLTEIPFFPGLNKGLRSKTFSSRETRRTSL